MPDKDPPEITFTNAIISIIFFTCWFDPSPGPET